MTATRLPEVTGKPRDGAIRRKSTLGEKGTGPARVAAALGHDASGSPSGRHANGVVQELGGEVGVVGPDQRLKLGMNGELLEVLHFLLSP